MRAWLQGALLAVLVFGASWGGAVWYWRATNRLPSPGDLLVYMLVLPLAVLGVFWLGKRMLSAASAAPAAVGSSSAAAPEQAATPAAMPALSMVAVALRTAHGANAQELAEALAANTARAELDPHLVDDDGYPILSARVQVDTDSVRDEFAEWLTQGTLHDPDFSDAQWTALTLATSVAGELASSAAAHSALQDGEATPGEVAVHTTPVPTLQLIALGALILGGSVPDEQWVHSVGLASLWAAAALTLITGYDYLRIGARHMD